MKESSRGNRGPRLADALILIAAIGVGMAGIRAVTRVDQGGYYHPTKFFEDVKRRGFPSAPYHIFYVSELLSPLLLAWTLALLPMELLRSGPRRAWRRPGFSASATAWIVVGFEALIWGLLAIPWLFGSSIVAKSLLLRLYPIPFLAYLVLLAKLGDAILAVWILQALAGRWRSEPDWIDRSGRLLGFLWIVQAPLFHWSSLLKT